MDYKKTIEFDKKDFTMKKVIDWSDEIIEAVTVAEKI
jgi:hypothetical protein